MRNLLILPFVLVLSIANAQNYFQLKTDIPVIVGSNPLLYPWAGGINFPVFSPVDLDGDGLEDLFAFDRSCNRVLCFINTGTGGINSYRYAPEFAKQFPALRGWALFYDYNCDGKADLFTTSVSNNGIIQFRNDSPPGSLLFTVADSVMKADYGGGSISGVFASGLLIPHFNDIDGDGDMDILGQQFFCVGTFAYYRNLSMDNYGVCDSVSKFRLDTYAWGNFALRSGAYSNVAVGQFHISCALAAPPADMFGYELAVQDDTYAGIYTLDIDDDGDMDALIGDSGARNSLLVYNGGTFLSADMDSQDTLFPSYNTPVNINAYPNYAYMDVDHDGKKDLLVGHNEFENKQGVHYYRNTGTSSLPVFNFIMNGFLQDEMIDVGEGAVPVLFDVDADGVLDLLIGNINSTGAGGTVSHGLTLYRNTGTSSVPSFQFVTNDYAGLSSYPLTGPLFPAFGDLDADGDMDMLLGHQTGELYQFENTAGAGMTANFVFASATYFGIDVGNFSSPQLIDLNRDGKLDLVIGKKSGVLAYYENSGTVNAPFFSSVPTKDTLGGINVQTFNYIDGFSVPFVYEDSGSYKILVSCMRGDIYKYGGIEGNIMGSYSLEDTVLSFYQGVRTQYNISVSGGDINNDGKIDMLVGLYGGGVQFYYQDSLINTISEKEIAAKLTVFPNPARSSFSLQVLSMKKNRKYHLNIYNSMGQTIVEKEMSSEKEVIQTEIFPPGVYFISIRDGEEHLSQRIVVIH